MLIEVVILNGVPPKTRRREKGHSSRTPTPHINHYMSPAETLGIVNSSHRLEPRALRTYDLGQLLNDSEDM